MSITRRASRIARCGTSKLIPKSGDPLFASLCERARASSSTSFSPPPPVLPEQQRTFSHARLIRCTYIFQLTFQLTLSYCQPRESRSGPAPSRRSAPPNFARSPPPPPRRSHRNPPSPLRIRRFPRTCKAYSI